ncbi:MAG: tetratricopeptide repeat protein [Fimbriimonadaceae bacterium]|nr:tetratricopeptide repeat protein [Fimbriimonadaceae bacterium]
MVACNQCNYSNSLDSKFCRQCGKELDATDVATAAAELDALIAQGFHAFNEGRTEEALLIAESATKSNPASASALSLKGMCHEREGQIAEALECYEGVVALNPDSALDKIKITQLRNHLAGRAAAVPKSNRPRAILGAVAAVVLVAAGASIAAVLTGSTPSDDYPQTVAAQPNLKGFEGLPPGALPSQADSPATTEPGVANPAPEGATQAPAGTGNGIATPNLGNVPSTLPSVGPDGFRPVQPQGPIGPVETRPVDTSAQQQQSPPRPTGADDPVDPVLRRDPVTEPPRENPGIIDIRVSTGRPAGVGGSSIDGNGVEALSRTARQQYQLGKYEDAARSYEQLLRRGGDPASTNQRLGQCYERLNKKPEAVAAYTRAVAAFDSQIKAGQGDSAKTGLDACKTALKILQGG